MPLWLSDLPKDALEDIFAFVLIKFPLKLACRAMREAHPDKTDTPHSFVLQTRAHLEWARGCEYECTRATVLRAARRGKADIVSWLVKTLCVEWNAKKTLVEACAGGSIDVLEFIEAEAHVDEAVARAIKPPDDEGSWPCSVAALHGHVHVLRWLRAHRHKVGRHTYLHACEGGHVSVLEALPPVQQPPHVRPTRHAEMLERAASFGHMNCALWLREHALKCCPPSPMAMVRAARGGHVDVLQLLYAWADAHGGVDAKARYHIMCNAASGDHLECVQFCVGVSAGDVTFVLTRDVIIEKACFRGASRVVRWFLEQALVTKVSTKSILGTINVRNIGVLKVLCEFGLVPKDDPSFCEFAAHYGELHALKLLREHGCAFFLCPCRSTAR